MFQEVYIHRIREKIFSAPKGFVFCIADLADCGSYDSIRKSLSRMTQENRIERIVPGVYWVKPDGQKLPAPLDLINALARNNNWTVMPGTELARYELGLSGSRPDYLCYLSSGPSGRYWYGENQYIDFQHCGSKFLSNASPKTALVISALLDLSSYPVSAEDVMTLSKKLTGDEKGALLAERILAPARLRCVLEIICGQYGKV